MQDDLFGNNPSSKTYRAIRHDIVRTKQRNNSPDVHHPSEKFNQINRVLDGKGLKILELFAGAGNLTEAYEKYGEVISYDKKLGTGNSFIEYHRLIADRKKFDVVDLDQYGFPSRFLPDIFLLIDDGYLFVTCPIPSINILNGITKTHLFSYFGSENPSIEAISNKLAMFGLCHWRQVEEIDSMKIDRMWRLVYRVKKVKATEYTGVNNR